MELKENYKLYCKIVFKVAKKLYCDKIIVNSKNKMKTTWNIIKSEKGRKYASEVYINHLHSLLQNLHNRKYKRYVP